MFDRKLADKKYYEQNKERIIARQKEYYKINSKDILTKEAKKYSEKSTLEKTLIYAQSRENKLNTIGWTQELYSIKFKEQNGSCAICHKPAKGRALDADHAHTNPPIPRGLLCNKCNQMIGLAGDDIRILENGISYLKKYQT
jgi:hypothetical protein